MGGGPWRHASCDRTIRHRRRTFAAGSRRPHPAAGLRTRVEGLGRGVDGVTNWRRLGMYVTKTILICVLIVLILILAVPILMPRWGPRETGESRVKIEMRSLL